MAERKFRFVSPGIFINEIDNSQLPNDLPDVGPIIVGRAERGPAMRPVRVSSPSEFVEYFGNPLPGGRGDDVWRDGNYVGPTYGAYAAMAYLRAGVGPVNYVRLLGTQHVEATTAGYAGWDTTLAPSATYGSEGGAYGLFLFNSGSGVTYDKDVGNGRLAAVFYTNGASFTLSGSRASVAAPDDQGSLQFIESSGASIEFTGVVTGSNLTEYKTNFNFDRNSSKYIRKVFNTNPQLQGGDGPHTDTGNIPNLGSKYWLGETFERFATTSTTGDPDKFITSTTAGDVYGIVVPLATGTGLAANYGYRRRGFGDPETGWVFSQNTSTTYGSFDAQSSTQKLFKIKALNHAEWASKSLKISISDIKASVNDLDSYGTFTVLVRRASDSDNVPEIVEQYTGCNLNAASENHVAKKIGDKYMSWSTTQKRLRLYGEFNNMSKYIYIEMGSEVADGTADASLLPFGFYGPIKPKDFTVFSGSTATFAHGSTTTAGTQIVTYATGSSAILPNDANIRSNLSSTGFMSELADGSGNEFTASFQFPKLALRNSASDGGVSNPKDAFFGVQTTLSYNSKRYDPGYIDYLRPAPGTSAAFTPTENTAMEYSFIFTLDDISGSQGVHTSGSAQSSTSLNAVNAAHTSVLDNGYNRFTMPLWGGFNGVDIQEMEPFNNQTITASPAEKGNYAYYTLKRAIDTVADPEFVEGNMLSVPGVWQPVVTDQVIAVAESRADALAVIDIENVYVANTETTDNFESRVQTVASAVSSLKNRRINSSYACTFYPWVRIRDDISNASLWVPPSVIAIGTFASSEARAELWFAPAGFTRGGLSTGAGGFGVLSTTERLRREDRDDLYEANINPIATFPSEGIVIFGQKTLQVTPSALDRINVRRLMIFLKKRISRIAAGILFDQNVQTTWLRFKTEADKFLGSVQAGLGLTEFRVVLDETTTTADLVDRNIMYAKIFLKPARAIEFIAIDFVITRTGASFDD